MKINKKIVDGVIQDMIILLFLIVIILQYGVRYVIIITANFYDIILYEQRLKLSDLLNIFQTNL